MKWREIMPPVVKPDNVDPKLAHETLLQIIAERKAREERRKQRAAKSATASLRRAKR
jgi:heme exporter protein D